jgi:hypothetical protein
MSPMVLPVQPVIVKKRATVVRVETVLSRTTSDNAYVDSLITPSMRHKSEVAQLWPQASISATYCHSYHIRFETARFHSSIFVSLNIRRVFGNSVEVFILHLRCTPYSEAHVPQFNSPSHTQGQSVLLKNDSICLSCSGILV